MSHKLMVLAAAKVQLAAHVELQSLDGAACDSHLLAPKDEGNHLDYYNSPAPQDMAAESTPAGWQQGQIVGSQGQPRCCGAQYAALSQASRQVQAAKPSPYGTGEHKAASAQLVLALLICQATACCNQPAGKACAVSCSCGMHRACTTTECNTGLFINAQCRSAAALLNMVEKQSPVGGTWSAHSPSATKIRAPWSADSCPLPRVRARSQPYSQLTRAGAVPCRAPSAQQAAPEQDSSCPHPGAASGPTASRGPSWGLSCPSISSIWCRSSCTWLPRFSTLLLFSSTARPATCPSSSCTGVWPRVAALILGISSTVRPAICPVCQRVQLLYTSPTAALLTACCSSGRMVQSFEEKKPPQEPRTCPCCLGSQGVQQPAA